MPSVKKAWKIIGTGRLLNINFGSKGKEKGTVWTGFLGVSIKPIPGKTRETVIQILPNEFCSEGEIESAEELKLQLIKEQEDVVIIAQTKQKQCPVIVYRKYGKGNILIINKSFCGGSKREKLGRWEDKKVGKINIKSSLGCGTNL